MFSGHGRDWNVHGKMELLFLLITAAYGEQTVFISSPAVPTDIINGRITGAIGRKVCGLTP